MGTPNWANQTIWTGDNLDIMRGMNSVKDDRGQEYLQARLAA